MSEITFEEIKNYITKKDPLIHIGNFRALIDWLQYEHEITDIDQFLQSNQIDFTVCIVDGIYHYIPRRHSV